MSLAVLLCSMDTKGQINTSVVGGLIGVAIITGIGVYIIQTVLGTINITGGMWDIVYILMPVVAVVAITSVIIFLLR